MKKEKMQTLEEANGEAIRKADELINKGTYNDVDRLVDSMNALEDSDLEILHKSPLP